MTSQRFVQCVLSFFVVFILSNGAYSANAAEHSPYRADFSLERVYEVATSAGNGKEIESVPTVRLKGRVRGVGFIDARFNLRKNKTWQATMRRHGRDAIDGISPVLLQGRLAAGGSYREMGKRIFPVAAAIIGKELKVSFPGRIRGKNESRQRVYTIKMSLDGSISVRARVSSIPKSVGRRGACGADIGSSPMSAQVMAGEVEGINTGSNPEIVPPIENEGPGPNTSLARVVTISTDADTEWYQKYGAESNAVIASIINTAEAIYSRQLGLRFRIVKQHVYSDGSPYNSTEPGTLLGLFTRNAENPSNLGISSDTFNQDVDLKHLFTGKDFDGTVIGIAYIGVVCAVPSLSYGITQAYMDVADPGIFAHELGHNFGANHDTSLREGLMYPSISIPPSQGFSDYSLSEVNTHLSKYGSCISLEQMIPRSDIPAGPTPTWNNPPLSAATITLSRSRVRSPNSTLIRLHGELLSSSQAPIGSVGVKLMVAGEEVGKSVTISSGRFEFFVKLDIPRGRKVYVYVETEGGEVFSNFIWLGRTLASDSRSARSSRSARR